MWMWSTPVRDPVLHRLSSAINRSAAQHLATMRRHWREADEEIAYALQDADASYRQWFDDLMASLGEDQSFAAMGDAARKGSRD